MRICVIGGGAAGMIAAGKAAETGAETVLFERNEKLGKKIYITGKGRCNLTNDCDVNTFLNAVLENPKFMMSSLRGFEPSDTMEFFEKLGVPLKVERGGRVFPLSEKASDISKALEKHLNRNSAKIKLNHTILKVKPQNSAFVVEYETSGTVSSEVFDRVILTTGGKSYPLTGSTGDGYRFLSELGHKIVPPVPALVSIKLGGYNGECEGLSLKNINAKIIAGTRLATGVKKSKDESFESGKPIEKNIRDEKKVLFEQFGEMLFTKDGVSGPVILSLSGKIARDFKGKTISIDLKPALSFEQLDARLQRDFAENINKQFKNILPELLPKKLIGLVLSRVDIYPEQAINKISREQRQGFARLLKSLDFPVVGMGGFNEAVVTAGGVDVKEVNPKTMESRLVKGLYIAGELLDVHATTGGYNLQIAFSTGFAAGKAAAEAE